MSPLPSVRYNLSYLLGGALALAAAATADSAANTTAAAAAAVPAATTAVPTVSTPATSSIPTTPPAPAAAGGDSTTTSTNPPTRTFEPTYVPTNPPTSQADANTITVDTDVYDPGQEIIVTFQNPGAGRYNWIAISETGPDVRDGKFHNDNFSEAWIYACGSRDDCDMAVESGQVTFFKGDVPAGVTYIAYLLSGDDPPFTVEATSDAFTVIPSPSPTSQPTTTFWPTYTPTSEQTSEVTTSRRPTSSPTVKRPLQFGDVNVVVVTDVHSWFAGHGAHEDAFDADYGDVLSFYQHLKRQEGDGKNLFFVMNGDFTGISEYTPKALGSILEHLPLAAINVGDHELYHTETIDFLTKKPGGFVDWWGGRYLTSNVLLASTGKSLGSRYTLLHGSDGATKVMVFGFLYDMPHANDAVVIEKVEDVVKASWFKKALKEEEYDAVMVMAHMDVKDHLVDVILKAIRKVTGPLVPVQFITGHTHVRANAEPDGCSSSFEAGRHLDTVGFVSFSKDATCNFEHDFIDANKEALTFAAAVDDYDDLETDDGRALSTLIKQTQKDMGLLDVVGCSPRVFSHEFNLTADDSFWRLYLEEIVPSSELFHRNDGDSQKVLIQGERTFQHNLFDGKVTVFDALCLSPYNDTFVQVGTKIPGSVIQKIHRRLKSEGLNTTTRFPSYAMAPQKISSHTKYDLYTLKFDLRAVSKALKEVHSYDEFEPVVTDIATTSMIIEFITNEWQKCPSKWNWPDALNPTRGSSNGESTSGWGWIVLVAGAAVFVGVAVVFFTYRERRRHYYQSSLDEEDQSSLFSGGDKVSEVSVAAFDNDLI